MPRDESQLSHQIAQAASAAAAPIGRVDTVEGTVTAQHVDGTVETLAQGAAVYQRDLIATKAGAKVALVFADKTTFALGESGQMRLDEMVYDPSHKGGKLALSMLKGAFAFVSGDIAGTESDAMTVRTPVGTIGIRGTAVNGNVDANGESTFSAVPDPSGRPSVVSFTNGAGTQVLTDNFTITVQTFFTAPSLPFATPAGLLSEIGALAAIAGAIAKVVNPEGGSTTSGPATPAPAPGPQGSESADSTPVVHVTLSETDFSSAGFTVGFTLTLAFTITQPLDQVVQIPIQLQISPPPPPAITGPTGLVGTLGVDHLVGGPGADFFNFSFIHNSLQSGDTVDGRGGADVLTATFDKAFAIASTLTITNVPTINLVIDGTSSLDALGITTGSLSPVPSTITVTGSGALTVTDLQVNFDASALAGAVTATAIVGGITIAGGQGANLLTGAGFGTGDVLSYAKFAGPIDVTYSTNTVMHGGVADTISGFDGVIGTAASDNINVSLPGGGHHFTVEGGAGNNTMTGSFADSDTLSYAHAPSGVSVNFGAGTASNGYGGTDSFSGFVAAIGSASNDTFVTTDTTVAVTGGGGNDTISVDGTVNNLTLAGVHDVIGANPSATSTNLLVLAPTDGFDVNLSGSGGANAVSVIGGTNGGVEIAGASDTVLVVGAGDTISSANGADNLAALGNGMVITAGNGADSVTAVGSGDLITVGNGDDAINVAGNNDTINYGTGRDTINVVGSDDVLTDAAPMLRDTITMVGNNDTLNLSGGNNAITVTGTNDVISSTAGDDSISVGGGSVTINFGALGDDPISFIGNGASATINFVNGADDLISMTGDDNAAMINGGNNTVTINNSGAGNAITAASDDLITVNMSGTNSSLDVNVSGNANSLVLNGTGSGTNELIVITGSGDSSLIAASLDDTISVGGSDDFLFIGFFSNSGPHTDVVTLSGFDDQLFVGSDDSVTASLAGSSDMINIFGDDAMVTLTSSGSSATVDLIAGDDDLLVVQGSNETITFSIAPSFGDDSVVATGNQDVIVISGTGSSVVAVDATGTNDTFSIIAQDDTILAGGNGGESFTISVSAVDDLINIVGNNDVITVGSTAGVQVFGDDDVIAGSGSDTFVVFGLDDTIHGGAGIGDAVFLSAPNNTITVSNIEELHFTSQGTEAVTVTGLLPNSLFDFSNTNAASSTLIIDLAGTTNLTIGQDSVVPAAGAFDLQLVGSSGGPGVGDLVLENGSYNLTFDGTETNFQTMMIDASQLGVGTSLTFDGSSESGSFHIMAGDGFQTFSVPGFGGDVLDYSALNHPVTVTITGLNECFGTVSGFGPAGPAETFDGFSGIIADTKGPGSELVVSSAADGAGISIIDLQSGLLQPDSGCASTISGFTALDYQAHDDISILLGSNNSATVAGGNDFIGLEGSGDTVIASGGDDVFSLNAGNDLIIASGGNDSLSDTPSGGNDTLSFLNGNDSITLMSPGNVISFGTGDDSLTLAGAGDTVNFGGANVTVTGFEGGNTLNIGSGSDMLVLSSPAYSFSNAANGSDANTDVINGFQDSGAHASVVDLSNLSGVGTESLVGGSLGTFAAGTPLSTAFAAAAANQVEYAVIGGSTFVHANGSGAGGYSAGDLLVELTGAHTLSGANFHLHP